MKITKKLTIILVIFYFIFFISYCSNSTSPQTTTFFGAVTLADTSDYYGVEVMLFKPVEIDTALLNLNKNYPGVGIELTQKTEFYWREQEPVYTTTTDAQGRWQIKKVEVGTYHIVYKKDGYGWRVQYDADGKDAYNISLKKAIIWQGTYNAPVTVPQNSFVNVVGNTVFNDALTLSAGTIVEFKNKENPTPQEKIKITVKGNLTIDGSAELPVYIVTDDTLNTDSWNVENVTQAEVNRLVMCRINNGFYFKQVPFVHIQNSRFNKIANGVTVSICDSLLIEENVFGPVKGTAIATFDCHTRLSKNFINHSKIGFDSKNPHNSYMQYNVFKQCARYAIALNLGGYAYNSGYTTVIYNDFFQNSSHILVGEKLFGDFNYNNFYDSKYFHVKALPRFYSDTLNFTQNYWGVVNIERKIYDKEDVTIGNYEGPYIRYYPYVLKQYVWRNN